MENNNIGKPKYGVIENTIFSTRVVAGIVTGVRYTDSEPLYELSFGNDKWWTSIIVDTVEEVIRHLNLPDLERVKQSHNLKIKFAKS